MATTTALMTFTECDRLPEPESFRYELRHGELVQVTWPRLKHSRVQRRLRKLIEKAASDSGVVETEFGFRALPEHEFRRADIGYTTLERWLEYDGNGHFLGAPEMVIEVLSDSNTVSEIQDKEKLCLENGCREFWIVNIDLRQVTISTPDGSGHTYRSGQQIPLSLFPGQTIEVDAIFADL